MVLPMFRPYNGGLAWVLTGGVNSELASDVILDKVVLLLLNPLYPTLLVAWDAPGACFAPQIPHNLGAGAKCYLSAVPISPLFFYYIFCKKWLSRLGSFIGYTEYFSRIWGLNLGGVGAINPRFIFLCFVVLDLAPVILDIYFWWFRMPGIVRLGGTYSETLLFLICFLVGSLPLSGVKCFWFTLLILWKFSRAANARSYYPTGYTVSKLRSKSSFEASRAKLPFFLLLFRNNGF